MADKMIRMMDDWMYPHNPAEKRYREDNEFRLLVDTLTGFICNNQFSPSELRAASWLASMKHENVNIRRMYSIIERNAGRPGQVCPCGQGWDGDGDGNCGVCSREGKHE